MVQPVATIGSSDGNPAEAVTNPDPLLSAEAAADYLGLVGVVRWPAHCVRAMARKRQLQSTRVASRLMFRRSWLEAYLSRHTRTAKEG